ncbi:MAG TPA: hypothetical protein H9881_01410 [Candidatus Stackebrandtia excrementipullorum]|nr:hypothetical protein [Candidatus Stackebrandtia excrementipullorum]
MKQIDEKPDIDGYEPRQRDARNIIEERRDVGPDFQRGASRAEYNQQAYRHPMPPRPRDIGVDEFDGREEGMRSMAAHPLFRGLLQELPARTSPPSKEWLDRWSSTARSILDLLYSRDSVT